MKTLPGRHQHIERDRRYRALNYLIQGRAADLLKSAAIELHEAGLEAVLYVHDEIVLEVDEADADQAGATLWAILASGAGKVEGTVGDHRRGSPLERTEGMIRTTSQSVPSGVNPCHLNSR